MPSLPRRTALGTYVALEWTGVGLKPRELGTVVATPRASARELAAARWPTVGYRLRVLTPCAAGASRVLAALAADGRRMRTP